MIIAAGGPRCKQLAVAHAFLMCDGSRTDLTGQTVRLTPGRLVALVRYIFVRAAFSC